MGYFPGDIISHAEMCMTEGVSLQKGMNFRLKGHTTIILMSTRPGAPYKDKVENDGEILIYEGHDLPKNLSLTPKIDDQPYFTPKGSLTENGKFFEAVVRYKNGAQPPEQVKVYEKIKDGIWVYNGIFELIDAWKDSSDGRLIYNFKLQITDLVDEKQPKPLTQLKDLDHNRMIPTWVKLEVWKRDQGRCCNCGSQDNLHFDHILPYSKGGTSLMPENIQLLCARHNLSKSNKII